MKIRPRIAVVALLSLLEAIACAGGGDQCLNPVPEFPSCGAREVPGTTNGGQTSSAAGGGLGVGNPSTAGAFAMVTGGSGSNPIPAGGAANGEAAAGSSDDLAGAGGDTAIEPGGGPVAGAAGEAGAAGGPEH